MRRFMAQTPRTGLVGAEGPSSGQPQGPLWLGWKLRAHANPQHRVSSSLNPYGQCGHTGWRSSQAGMEGDRAGVSLSLQAEEDKEEQTDSQPDASSSQTVTPVAEPPSTEPTPPEGPTSLGPLDLLRSEELLTDTSNSSSSTGEEGEAGDPRHLLCFHKTAPAQTGVSMGLAGSWD